MLKKTVDKATPVVVSIPSPVELPLTSEGKIDFQAIFSPIPLTRDSFETKEQFAKRLQEFDVKQLQLIEIFNQAALRHDSRVQAGTVQLFKDKYNADTQEFEVNVQPAAWVEKLSLSLISVAKITIAPNDAKALFHEGQLKPLFLIIKQQGEVQTASGFLVGLGKAFGLKPVENAQPKVGETFRDKLKDGSLGPEMVQIPAGTFQMGSNDGDSDEKPVHTVSVKSFALGKYEVTRGEFRKFVEATSYKTDAEKGDGCYGWTGSEWKKDSAYNWKNVGFTQDDKHPVVCVSWNDAKAYVKWLSEQTGKNYRLPSEAQWEYAVRAGSTTKYFWGENVNEACRYANVADKKVKEKFPSWLIVECNDGYTFTSPAGIFTPNKFGLYDMTGNVWEWLEDKWHSDYSGATSDGSAWMSGDSNIYLLRVGSWGSNANLLRCAFRGRNDTALRLSIRGFRISRVNL